MLIAMATRIYAESADWRPSRRVRPTLARFVMRRTGTGGQSKQLWNLLVRPFAAKSFSDFWRLWNPFYGYYLFYYCYKPLRRVVARPLAELATFAVSGFFLHDLALMAARRTVAVPYLTIWFVLAGAIAIVAERLHMDTSKLPFAVRCAINLTYLLATMTVVVILTVA